MNHYTTTILVDQNETIAFNAINNVRNWWQGEIIGNTDKLDDEFTYCMEPHHYSKQKIVEWIPNKKVVWLITECNLNFVNNKLEWLDTVIIFEITTVDGKTKITFTHQGLNPKIECYEGCSNAWEKLIQISLVSLINTGKGIEVF